MLRRMVKAVPWPPMLTAATLLAQISMSRPPRRSATRTYLAIGLIGASLGVSGWSAVIFGRAGTTIEPGRPEEASVLLDHGPFSLSRNPIYLAMTTVTLANALRLGRWRAVLPSLALFGWFNLVQVPREERAIAANFGPVFDDYRAGVRRWL